MTEQHCVKLNNPQEKLKVAFGKIKSDKYFTDVTLACEDGQQVEAHKVVLVASSPFFHNLKRNKHPHPLIYMRGVRPENLMAMVDFFYHGEANVYQENLDSFLVLAEELQLKGLRGNQTEDETEYFSKPSKQKSQAKSPKHRSVQEQNPWNKVKGTENGAEQAASEKVLVRTDQATNNTDLEGLDQQVKSMMDFSENADQYGKRYGRARICKVCGKEGGMGDIMNHPEAHHIAGISIPCGLCGHVVKTRNALIQHRSKHHRNQ